MARLAVVGGVPRRRLFAEPGKPATTTGAFRARPGGAPANLAAAAAKLGLDVTFIGKVGDDDLGRGRCELPFPVTASTHRILPATAACQRC